MSTYIVERIRVNEQLMDDARYEAMFSVEEVNRLDAAGMPFRDAYRKVGVDIEAGRFKPCKEVHHTHAGSMGNLCNDRIKAFMQGIVSRIDFGRALAAEKALVE